MIEKNKVKKFNPLLAEPCDHTNGLRLDVTKKYLTCPECSVLLTAHNHDMNGDCHHGLKIPCLVEVEQKKTFTSEDAKKLFEVLDAEDADKRKVINDWLVENEDKYQPHLEKAVKLHLQNLLKACEAEIDTLEEQYIELTNAKVKYSKRKEVSEKLNRDYMAKDSFTKSLQNLQVIPLSHWIDENDIEVIARDGFLKAVGSPWLLMRAYVNQSGG